MNINLLLLAQISTTVKLLVQFHWVEKQVLGHTYYRRSGPQTLKIYQNYLSYIEWTFLSFYNIWVGWMLGLVCLFTPSASGFYSSTRPAGQRATCPRSFVAWFWRDCLLFWARLGPGRGTGQQLHVMYVMQLLFCFSACLEVYHRFLTLFPFLIQFFQLFSCWRQEGTTGSKAFQKLPYVRNEAVLPERSTSKLSFWRRTSPSGWELLGWYLHSFAMPREKTFSHLLTFVLGN